MSVQSNQFVNKIDNEKINAKKYSITLNPLLIDNNTLSIIKSCKYKFIQHLNFSGVLYISIRWVSGILNESFLIASTKETKTIDVYDSFYIVESYDREKILEYTKNFMNDLKSENIDPNIISYFDQLIKEATEILVLKTRNDINHPAL